MKAGEICEGMSFESYHAFEAASSSLLSMVRISPAHCLEYLSAKREVTDALKIGQAVHCYTLEPDKFSLRFVEGPDCDRRTKDGKAEWANFLARHEGKAILKRDQFQTVLSVGRAIAESPTAAKLLEGAHPELSIFWESEGEQCKGRLDAWNADMEAVVDIKTTQDASPRAFERTIFQMGYYRQAAWYMEGMAECGLSPKTFVFIAVEKEPPYGISFHAISPTLIKYGKAENNELLKTYSQCRRSNSWPGYPATIREILPPPWLIETVKEQDTIQEF